MADAASTPDYGALLDQAQSAQGAPLQATPAAFSNFVAPYAQQVSQATGIDPNTIVGQWGLETGWGKSIIPGTNNLANIKSTAASGPGVAATDNALGTSSQYQSFPSLSDFAAAHAALINGRYPKAAGTGSNVAATAAALANGGFAQDPNYAAKLVAASQTAAAAAPQASTSPQPDFGALLDAAGFGSNTSQPATNVASAPPGTPINNLPFEPSSTFDAKYAPPGGAQPVTGSSNPVTALGAGVGEGFGKAVLGAQALVGKGLTSLGSSTVGPWLTNDAQTGNTNLTNQANAAAAGHPTIRTVGNVLGETAPFLAAPTEVGPQVIAGGISGADNAALNNQPIAPAFVEGAGIGGAGAVAGQVLGAGVKAATPAIQSAISAVKGGENAAASKIASAVGTDNLPSVIDTLNANSDEIIPGSIPTAADTGASPAIATIQKGLQNSPAGQEAFPLRQAQNDAARVAAGQEAVGSSLESDADAFTQAQTQRVAAGQDELPPVSDAQAQVMQTPAYISAMKAARNSADESGIPAFTDSQDAIQAGLANDIQGVAGTPDSLEAMRNARSNQAQQDYAGVSGPILADTQAFQDLEARPGFRQAFREGAGIEDNIGGSNAPDPFTHVENAPQLQVAGDGTLNWVNQPPTRFADAGVLQAARSRLSSMANVASRVGDNAKAQGYLSTLGAVDDFLGNAEHVGRGISSSFTNAKANYAAASAPIDAASALQQRLAGAVNPLDGTVNPTALSRTITGVQSDQLKPGLRPADRVTDDQLTALQALGQRAQAAPNNLTGLSGQGQEILRQALEANANKAGADLKGQGAQAAHDAYQNYLIQNSPAYKAFFEAQEGTGKDIESRQVLSQALDKLQLSSHNVLDQPSITFNGAKSLNNLPLSGGAKNYADNLIADLQRRTTGNAALGAAGSQTAANLNLQRDGLLGRLVGHKLSDNALGVAIGTGHLIGALSVAVGKHLLESSNVRTNQAAINLLLNPKQLASALQKYADKPSTQETFIDALKQKATGAGAVGVRAVQAFEAAQGAH